MMKSFCLSEIKGFFAVAILFAAAIFLFAEPIAACSWDYPIWQVRTKNADPLYRFIKNGKAGYIDQTGKIVVQPTIRTYGNYGYEFNSGLLGLYSWEGPYIDVTGKIAIPNDFYRTYGFSEGLAIAVKNDGDKAGYIDKTGKFVIEPGIADSLGDFSEGLATAKIKELEGFIDKKGKFAIEPKFLRADNFSEGLARVIVEGPCAYYNFDDPCQIANPPQYLPESAKAEIEKQEKPPLCKFTFIDKEGKIITAERFDRAGSFSEGLAAVLKNEKWGYIDKNGQMVIAPQFDSAASFSDGLALVQQNELAGYVDKTGKFVIAPRFKRADDFHDGLAVVGKNWNKERSDYDDYYFIDKKGEPAFAETFYLASHFFKGLAHVKVKTEAARKDQYNYSYKGTFAYIDTKGKKIFVYERKDGDDD